MMQSSSTNTNNPWYVDNLEEFLYYFCPECDNVKHQSRTDFINHALDQHPDSKDCISRIIIKKEKTKHDYSTSKFAKNNHNINEENSEEYDDVGGGEENEDNAESADFNIQNYVKCEISEDNANDIIDDNKNLSEDSATLWNENAPLKSTSNYNIYICDVCEKTFNDKLAFKRHIKVHDESNRHKCDKCEKSFKSETKLQDHIDWYHSGIKKYTCIYCQASFGTVQQLSVHMSRKNHEGIKDYVCTYCTNKAFSNSNDLKKHIQYFHEGEKNHICELCNKKFGSLQQLTTHLIRKNHNNSDNDFSKTESDNEIKQEPMEQNDVQKEENENLDVDTKYDLDQADDESGLNLTCGSCGKYFSSRTKLKEHVDKKLRFKCAPCGKVFSYLGRLRDHIGNLHSDDKKGEIYICDLCDLSQPESLENLKEHLKNVHECKSVHKPKVSSKAKEVICDLCGKSFSFQANLKRHIIVFHEGKKDYKCDACGKAFGEKNDLKRHVSAVHEGIKNHICDLCKLTIFSNISDYIK